jgi:hypothetical protein
MTAGRHAVRHLSGSKGREDSANTEVRTFFIPPGQYLARAEAPGCRNVAQTVTAKTVEPGISKAQSVIICLQHP